MPDGLNSFLFSTTEMSHVFSPQEQLRAMMRFEWALTCALEKQGLAEAGSGAVLHALLDAHFVNIDAMESEAKQVGNISIPFVRQLTAAVKARDERCSRAIHLGATSQDLVDTALVLQMRDAVALFQAAMKSLDASLTSQVRTHRETVSDRAEPGCSPVLRRHWASNWPAHSPPFVEATTAFALQRNEHLVLQFGGAVGTLAALGDAGSAVSRELARLLDLREPELPWHTQRDNLVEMAQALALLTGTLAKFARDIALLMQAEVGEASEATDMDRGGSSTMPHKQNPVACAAVLAAHAKMPGLVQTLLNAMPQEHERGLGSWQAEWDIVPEAFRLTAAALQYSIEIANGLVVDHERMQANLDALLGVTLSEAVSAALAPKVGRSAAHDLLRDAVLRVKHERRHLGEVLKQIPEVSAHLSNDDIDRLLNPRAYLGSAQRFITRVLEERHGYD